MRCTALVATLVFGFTAPVLGACSSADGGTTPDAGDVDPGTPDAGVPDARICNATKPEVVEFTCDGEDNDCNGRIDDVSNPPPWFPDVDGDGQGANVAGRFQCAQPEGFIATSGDCDDTTPLRRTGLPEVCDGLDNDCDVNTADSCAHGCQVKSRLDFGNRRYLFCTDKVPYAVAKGYCERQGMELAVIGDDPENVWIDMTGGGINNSDGWWIGATDGAPEGTWVWRGTTPFWINGTTQPGQIAPWSSNEPNDDGEEDCGEITANGTWNDNKCGSSLQFICEQL